MFFVIYSSFSKDKANPEADPKDSQSPKSTGTKADPKDSQSPGKGSSAKSTGKTHSQ